MLNIFNVKLNNSISIEKKDYDYRNEKGIDRHYPPANIEWYNSIYAYNKNTTKLLPRADKALLKFLKSYFNLYSIKLERKIKKSPSLRFRFRKTSVKRVLVSRAELKHTSEKVNITIYIYNRHQKFYLNKIKKIRSLNMYKSIPRKKKLKIIVKKGLKIISNVLEQKKILFKTLNQQTDNSIFNNYENKYLKIFIRKSLRREIKHFYIKQIIFINKSKFKSNYLLPLTSLIEKYYKQKKIEFNLVNLKYLYLNSYIFTDTIVKKIKNKKNNFRRVLKRSLMFIKPFVDRLVVFDEMYNKMRISQNLKVNHILSNSNYYKQKAIEQEQLQEEKQEKVNQIDSDFDSYKIYLRLKKIGKEKLRWKEQQPNILFSSYYNKIKKIKKNKRVIKIVLDSIKYKFVKGIRIEAAGRLSKRYTAAKSLFKKVYRGNLRNMDSSFKKLSTVILRGHCKSNLQYTKLNSKRRIGSYGIKGWVSSSN